MIALATRLIAQAGATVNCLGDAQCETGLPVINANDNQIQVILQIAFGIIAASAVIIIIVAALRFVTAQGDPQEVAGARKAIIYSLIGLAVAVSAEALVTFVLTGL